MKSSADFRSKVLYTVLGIGYGKTISYKELARRIRRPYSYRAVGKVLKENPYILIIPCHRVVSSSKGVGGYVLGEALKRRLIAKEKSLLKLVKNFLY